MPNVPTEVATVDFGVYGAGNTNDIVHFKNGDVIVAWIDYLGKGQGNLASSGGGGGTVGKAQLTTSANPTDTITIFGFSAASVASLMPTNALAAAMMAAGKVETLSKSTNTLVISHPATAGATFDIVAVL